MSLSHAYGEPMADAWQVHGQDLECRVVDVPEAADLARRSGALTWLEVSPSELAQIGPMLDIHPQAIADAVHGAAGSSAMAQRTKVERFPRCELVYLFCARLDEDADLKLTAAPLILLPGSVIAVAHERPITQAELVPRWERNPQLLEHGVAALWYGFLDFIVDSYLDTVDSLSEAVDRMEDDLFDDSSQRDVDPRAAQLRSFTARKSLVRLRRVTQPMREVVSGIMRRADADQPVVDAALLPYYQDVYDHVLRVNDTVEGLRDLITTIYETRLALNDHSLNTVTRQLAAWAAIIAVPTAVTGFYGQNIPYPGFAAHSGFWTSTGIWVGVSILLYAMFKRRRWL
jgi:magnesium transporter